MSDQALNCPWPIDVTECCDQPDGEEDLAVIDKAKAKASAMMTRLSGYTIGQCAVSLRPLSDCAECRTTCCGGADAIRLRGPKGLWITEVTEVRLGSDIYDDTTWHFDKELQMLWRSKPERWPTKDERWQPDGEEGAFVVDAVVGSEPDAWAMDVANELACELVKSCTGGQCRIPKNATNVNAQGINVLLSDVELKMLIPAVAGWVDAVNPYKATLPGRIYSSDLKKSLNKGRGGCCGSARY